MQTLGHVLVIDDDAEMREMIGEFLKKSGYEVMLFPLATEAFEFLRNKAATEERWKNIDAIVSDIQMPEMDGMEFVERVKRMAPEIPVILVTAFGSIESAIEATRIGAYDYIIKPFKLTELGVRVSRAVQFRHLQKENILLKSEVKKGWTYSRMVGKGKAMRVVFDLIERVAHATANVLITGESGTGKEMAARAIHEQGPRAQKPFIAINCTAIPESLLESELFGHAKGSFTGAIARKKGLFEEAQGGTIFLDEIGDMDFSLQAKLLRVLQEKRIRPVGDNEYKEIDVRIISATHKDLPAAVKDGRFREDLYYRLSVIPINLPSLRHRKEDIPLLANFFLEKYASANSSRVKGFTPAAMEKMLDARWDGNVRELENLVERLVVLTNKDYIDVEDLPLVDDKTIEDFYSTAVNDMPTVEQLEKRYIQYVLEKTGGRKEKASQILGINRRTLYRKEREYGLATHPDLEEEPAENA